MSDYQDITGTRIKYLSSDPTLESSYEGQVWYNSTTGVNKAVVGLKAWSTSGAVITARFGTAGGISDQGPQSSTIFFGGQEPSFSNKTEEYNGSGSTNAPNLPTAIAENMGCGTSTAALSFGGLTNPSTHVGESYEYDGSSWGSETDLNTSRYTGGGAGTQTAGLACGGYTTTHVANTEEYNGSAWTNVNSMNTARYSFGTAGVQTSAIIVSGVTTTRVNSAEEYDGTNWTSVTNYPISTGGTQGFGATNTTAIFAGGGTSPPTLVTTCLEYDGSSFSAVPSLNNSASGGYASGSNSAGVYLTGIRTAPGTSGADVEEYNNSINTITAAVFATGGTANTTRRQLGYTTNSPQNDFMGYGGFSPSGFLNNSETYNGTSWTEGNNLNESKGQLAGAGESSPAALAFGGNSNNANTEEYNGTSWSEVNNMNNGRYELGGCGTQTAALACGGDLSPPGSSKVVNTEEYDGTNWTTGGDLNTSRRENDAAGTQTAAIVAGGGVPSGTTATETYNGTAWTTVNSKIRATIAPRTMGGPTSQTAAVTAGGHDGSAGIVGTEQWNGTNFVTGPNMNQQRFSHTAGGSIAAGIVAFGDAPTPAYLKTSEEFTGETTTVTASTLTTS